MHEIKINISTKLKNYLDRYFSHEFSLEQRFFIALAEGDVICKGKSFALKNECSEKLDKALIQDIEHERYFQNNE